MHFAGAKYGVRRPALAGAAVDVAGLRQVDRDAARNAAERLAPADDAGDRLFIHAVLQRHDVAVRRQILPDQHGGPGRVVGFHADEGDVDRRLLGELLGVGDVQRAHGNREFRDVASVGDAQAVPSHVLDMLGPWIDERDVLARLHHVGAGISADGARSDNRYLPTHAFLPAFLEAEASRRLGRSQTANRVAPGASGSPPIATEERTSWFGSFVPATDPAMSAMQGLSSRRSWLLANRRWTGGRRLGLVKRCDQVVDKGSR